MTIMTQYVNPPERLAPWVPSDFWNDATTRELVTLYIAAQTLVDAGMTMAPRLEVLPGHAGQAPIRVAAITLHRLRRRFNTAFDGPAVLRPYHDGGAM